MVGVSILKGFCKGERERERERERENGSTEKREFLSIFVLVNDPVDWGKDIQVIPTLLF